MELKEKEVNNKLEVEGSTAPTCFLTDWLRH